jgi:hypothetical protein
MMAQHGLMTAGAAALAVTIAAGVADWRRTHRRRDLDNPGWVPWRGIQVFGFFAVLLLAILWMKAG